MGDPVRDAAGDAVAGGERVVGWLLDVGSDPGAVRRAVALCELIGEMGDAERVCMRAVLDCIVGEGMLASSRVDGVGEYGRIGALRSLPDAGVTPAVRHLVRMYSLGVAQLGLPGGVRSPTSPAD